CNAAPAGSSAAAPVAPVAANAADPAAKAREVAGIAVESSAVLPSNLAALFAAPADAFSPHISAPRQEVPRYRSVARDPAARVADLPPVAPAHPCKSNNFPHYSP